jgi:hypothetical protein
MSIRQFEDLYSVSKGRWGLKERENFQTAVFVWERPGLAALYVGLSMMKGRYVISRFRISVHNSISKPMRKTILLALESWNHPDLHT